jgi:hypothetical protein
VISTSVNFEAVGTPYSGDDLRLTCPIVSYFAFWLTVFKPIAWATWIVKANVFWITRHHRRTLDSVP